MLEIKLEITSCLCPIPSRHVILRTTPYHPQGNGEKELLFVLVKIFNQKIVLFFRVINSWFLPNLVKKSIRAYKSYIEALSSNCNIIIWSFRKYFYYHRSRSLLNESITNPS